MLPRAHGGLRRPDQCLASFRKPRVMINERGIMVRLPLRALQKKRPSHRAPDCLLLTFRTP